MTGVAGQAYNRIPMPVVYLRHSTTAPLDVRVRALMTDLLIEDPRLDHGLLADGRRVAELLTESRRGISRWCGADPDEIVFTSSGTESCNLALKGVAMSRWRAPGPGGRILVAATEHTAVLYPARTLGRLGLTVTEIPVGGDGVIDPGLVARMIGTDTFLVSVAGVTAETGTIQPISELSRVAHEGGALLHADLCLAAVALPLDVHAMGIDLASVSAHKLGGPRGAGALFLKKGVRIAPLIEGGMSESGLRGGAENVAGIAGFAAAASYRREALTVRNDMLSRMGSRLEAAVLTVPDVTLNGAAGGRVPGMINISVAGIDGEALLLKLASRGIAASSGSSCLTEIGKPSHVLTAMGIPPELARGSLLFSIGDDNTMDEIDHVIRVFPEAVASLRRISVGKRQ